MRADWRDAVIYQIYPRSFKDSNGDGIGDIKGIIEKIPYLKDLGVNAVWISPMYKSPMKDFGYDVSDHCAIEPVFGTMDDFETMATMLEDSGIKLIMDYIPNHTSDRHPWFLESRTSKDNPKRDWYIWADPKPDGSPPNNWLSIFGGSRWTLDKTTGQYYLHTFLKEQPDLNWRNPEVVTAMTSVMKFWLDKGVDGFRVDGFEMIFKDPQLRDNPVNDLYEPQMIPHMRHTDKYTFLRSELYPLIRHFQDVCSTYPNILIITETWRLTLDTVQDFYKAGNALHFPFNIEFITMEWNAIRRRTFIDAYDRLIGGTYLPNYVLGNHDLPRMVTRFGRDAARAAAILQLTLRGVPTIYYGEELGMENCELPQHLVQDPSELNQPGLGHGRDPMRTPMKWNGSENAGFSDGKPWLPVCKDYKNQNAEAQKKDSHSFINLYKTLIKMRETNQTLIDGNYQSFDTNNDELFGYTREYNGGRIAVVINFSSLPQGGSFPFSRGKTLFNSHMQRINEEIGDAIMMDPYEGVVIAL